jgi:Arc/MetJ-type ribon-helix-helix transcriptional regulator
MPSGAVVESLRHLPPPLFTTIGGTISGAATCPLTRCLDWRPKGVGKREEDDDRTKGKPKRKRRAWAPPSKPEAKAKRDVSVMTRLTSELVELLDVLVKLDVFGSRSEGVASIVEKTLLSQLDKFELLRFQIERLEEIHDEARNIASDVLGATEPLSQ